MNVDFSSYTVIDVETPNEKNDSICSIACVHVVEGEIKEKVQYLVNPESQFSEINIKIHGITSNMIKNKPTFPDIWENIKTYFITGYPIVAHNAKFDLNVIRKTLEKYEIKVPIIYYFCTLELAKQYVTATSYSLNNLCDMFQIKLINHHDSLSDSIACDELFSALFNKYQFDPETSVKEYNINAPKKEHFNKTTYSPETKDMQELKTLASYIIKEENPLLDDITNLLDFVDVNLHLMGNYPFDNIYNIRQELKVKNVPYSKQDLKLLIDELNKFVNPIENTSANTSTSISFKNKVFCLSGTFINYTKTEIKEKLLQKEAICKDSITKLTDYLIVGSTASDSWKFGNYGSKVAKALEMQDKGHRIQIIAEKDFILSLLEN